jgi:putative FmdB family regulatory protein
MPIYEYVCSSCGYRFEKLVRSMGAGEPKMRCPQCHKDNAQRAVSSFAVGGGALPGSPVEPAPVSGG